MLNKLDHVNIRTRHLDAMIGFYTRVLGLSMAYRPPFPFPGAWLYCGDQAVVHLIGVEDETPSRDPLQLEHFAFAAAGLAEFLAHLRAEKVPYSVAIVPGLSIRQVNLHDVDGNHLHVDFTAEEEADLSTYDGA